MARVFFPSTLRKFTGETQELTLAVGDVRELLRVLEQRFPGIAEAIASGMTIAIDGEILHDPLLEPVGTESEVHFVPSISGGSAEPSATPRPGESLRGAGAS